jgi:hypothetical protein
MVILKNCVGIFSRELGKTSVRVRQKLEVIRVLDDFALFEPLSILTKAQVKAELHQG